MRQLDASHLRDWIADQGREPPALLDVRELWELALCVIEGSVAIPMSEIIGRLHEIDRAREWVVVCHHGLRSQQVAMLLQYEGFPRVQIGRAHV